MREIKFRGKAKMSVEELNELGLKHEKGWVIGSLVIFDKTPYIAGDFIEMDAEYMVGVHWVEVIPDTVGQFAWLKDKNGKEIYEGDILCKEWGFGNKLSSFCKVVFEKGCFGFYWLDVEHLDDESFKTFWSSEDNEFHWNPSDFEVVGNIYENPELLEGME